MENQQNPTAQPPLEPLEKQKHLPLKVWVPVLIAAVLVAGYFVLVKKDTFVAGYQTYDECVQKTKLPCKFYYVGDLGQEWRPSPFRSKEECDRVVRIVGHTCVIPPGNFREERWINSVDLERAGVVTKPEEKTANWKTYRNENLGFELKIPVGVIVDTEFNDEHNRLVVFQFPGSNNIFEVRLKEGKSIPLDQYYYLDLPVAYTADLGGEDGLVFQAPNGYCDGPGCSEPFVAQSAKRGDYFYNLVFYGDGVFSDEELTILSTFKFIK